MSKLAVLLIVLADACGALHAGLMAGAPPHVRCSAASPRASTVIMVTLRISIPGQPTH